MESLISFAVYFISIFIQVLQWCIFIWIILGWFATQKNGLGAMLDQIVIPLLRPFRWARIGMISLAPLILLILLQYGGQLIIQSLLQLI